MTSLATLPFRLVPVSSSPKRQQPFAISSSPLRASLPISSAFGFGSHSLQPLTRSTSLIPISASDETESTTVETLESETSEESETQVTEVVVEEEATPLRPPIVKLGDIMGILNKRAVDAAEKERPVPDLRTGDIVEIKLEVPENRRRASIYKGIVISKQNAWIHTTIRIRRIIAGIGVEIVFPVHSPNIKEIKVVKHRKVRRARLYYLRDKLPRLSTFK